MDDFASQLRLLVALIDYERCTAPNVDEAVRRALAHCDSFEGVLVRTLRNAQASLTGAEASQVLVQAGDARESVPLILVGVTCDLFNRIQNSNLSVGFAAEPVLKSS